MNNLHPQIAMTSKVGNTQLEVYTYDTKISKCEHIMEPLMHKHHTEEFSYIYEGAVHIYISDNKQEIILNKGDLCLIPAGMYHYANSDSVERICFEARITTEKAGTDPLSKRYSNILRTLRSLDKPLVIRSAYIDNVMEHYRKICTNSSTTLALSGTTIMMSVVTYTLDSITTYSGTDKPTSLHTHEDERKHIIERFITECYNNKYCLSMLSKALCLSERRTSSLVREIMHKSFKELIVEERMRVADMLRKNGKHSLEEIAQIVGYSSYSGFYTAWLHFYGQSPTEHP